jgi:Fe2+ transport system protein FeoA
MLMGWEEKMFLHSAKEGSFAIVKEMRLEKSLLTKLFSLGITPGAKIQVLKNDSIHPLILIVNGCRLVMERKIASQIEIEQ